MKIQVKTWIYNLLLISAFGFIVTCCTKEEEPDPYISEIPFNPNIVYDTVTDIDGNVYKTVVIGTQTWMAENLKTTHFNDGNAIPLIEDASAWAETKSAGYCWFKNDEATYRNTYGALYNWHAVSSEKLCPDSTWHVAKDVDWQILEDYLLENGYNCDNTNTVNHIAKSLASSTGWFESRREGAVGNNDFSSLINKTGFTAMPGGYRDRNGLFTVIGYHGNWWTADGYSDSTSWARDIYCEKAFLSRYFGIKENGISVRCVKN